MRLHGRDRTREFRDLARTDVSGEDMSSSSIFLRPTNLHGTSFGHSTSDSAPGDFPTDQASRFDRDGAARGAAGCPSGDETEFYRITTTMGQRLNVTQQRITQVEKLVKQKGIFEDHTAEIQAATYEIRQSIVEMNTQLDAIERAALGNASSVGPHVVAHYRSVIQALRARVGEATIQLKHILELRAQSMKSQEDRRGLYSHSHTSPHGSGFFASDDPECGGTAGSEGETLMPPGQKTMTQLFRTRQFQPLYHTARAEAIENVQHMIGELAQIFNRVASLVTAQEELAIRIEDDMSSALHNLQQGEAHLAKYLRSISSNRTLIIKVFAVLLFFVMFFILFLT